MNGMEKTFAQEMLELLGEKKYSALKQELGAKNGADIATAFGELRPEQIPLLFRLLPKELAAETFVEMEPEDREVLIHGFSDAELGEVINELFVDDAVDLVEEMPRMS